MLNNKINFEETALIKDIKIYEKGSEFPAYFKFTLCNSKSEIIFMVKSRYINEDFIFDNKILKKSSDINFNIKTLDKLIKKFLYDFYK